MPELIPCSMASLAIASLYYTWRERIRPKSLPATLLRQRVAYMMWVAARQ
ncbi:hypothetical protein KIH39_05400 [Telmatocola sphagniphila]|uniref:Uncharacterized protein n=1 Tax=Telmatocola sphagniphila TaxID=1123043 RepID=A0A8E6BAE5_9BACT|nr:hypothetical protein [Telmatocola sphagniphila]QVL33350.1 hypothetical protein KIH39_05400 [Telmatocola sphagniphila]